MNDFSYEYRRDTSRMSDGDLFGLIGEYVQKHRLNQDRTQAEVAKDADISRSTLSLLEKGEKVNLNSLIKVLRILDLLHVFEPFTLLPQKHPIDMVEEERRQYQRQRASGTHSKLDEGPELEW